MKINIQYVNDKSKLASEIIKRKLIELGNKASVTSLNGKKYFVETAPYGFSFFCDALPVSTPYEFRVFDVIVSLLINEGGRASKGIGRGKNVRLGDPNCQENTVVGAIAKYYSGVDEGTAVYDPVFALAAILEWANIAYNKRGYLELTESYKKAVM